MSLLQTKTDLEAAARAIREHDRFLITTHENPDGDALGSILAAKLALDTLGKDAVMYLYGQVPLPRSTGSCRWTDLRREVPADARRARAPRPRLRQREPARERLRRAARARAARGRRRPPSRQHPLRTVNAIVADASSTGEIVRDLLRLLGVELTPEIAEALYIALVTDTGRFQYTNTTPKALRLAAELVEAGATSSASSRGCTRASSSPS